MLILYFFIHFAAGDDAQVHPSTTRHGVAVINTANTRRGKLASRWGRRDGSATGGHGAGAGILHIPAAVFFVGSSSASTSAPAPAGVPTGRGVLHAEGSALSGIANAGVVSWSSSPRSLLEAVIMLNGKGNFDVTLLRHQARSTRDVGAQNHLDEEECCSKHRSIEASQAKGWGRGENGVRDFTAAHAPACEQQAELRAQHISERRPI